MTHAVDDVLMKVFPDAPWMLLPTPRKKVVTMLSEALGPDWVIERETDSEGEVSIIAVSALDVEQLPALILYEKDGQIRVATIRCDQWENDHGFTSFEQATNAFIAEAKASVAHI